MTENKEQNKSKDWRFAPQPVRLYRSKYAARCVFAISRRLARAKTDLLPVMNGLERDARRSRTAGSDGLMRDGDVAALRGRLLGNGQREGLAQLAGLCREINGLMRQVNQVAGAFGLPLPVMHGYEVGGYLAAMDGLVSEQLGLAHKLGIEPDTEDLSRTAELAELARQMHREAA